MIPVAAIEAAEKAYWQAYGYADSRQTQTALRAAIEAAMPAIREALAQEIEAHAKYEYRHPDGLPKVRAFGSGLRTAARIVRGDA